MAFPSEFRYQKINERKRKTAKTRISDLTEPAPFFVSFSGRIPSDFSTADPINRKYYSSADGSFTRALLSTLSFTSPPASIII